MSSLLNRSAVKKRALDIAESKRNGRFNRVSKEFLDRIEARLAAMILAEVERHPSVGKTLK